MSYSDRVVCEKCGKDYTKSNKTKHIITKYHKLYEKLDEQLANQIANDLFRKS
jgi:hypothetical protein